MNVTTERKPRCRYADRRHNLCTAEAVEEGAEIMLCTHHLGLTAAFLARVIGQRQGQYHTQLDALAEELAAVG